MLSYEYTYHDEDRQVEYEFMVHQNGDDRTFDLIGITDWSFDEDWGVELQPSSHGSRSSDDEKLICNWFENIVDKLGLDEELDQLAEQEREREADREIDRQLDGLLCK